MALVTLTTDFGTQDGYVGAMKGVIRSLAPDADLVDITHAVPPHDIPAGAFALAQAAPYFPVGTIHVAVVDPGVGGERAAVVATSGGHVYIGPDNGVLSLIAPTPGEVYAITADGFYRDQASATFHGRDVFAVCAGRIAAGARPADAGPAVDLLGMLTLPLAGPRPDGRFATVIHVDAFGNLITDTGSDELPSEAGFKIANHTIARLSTTFESVERGELVAYIGSGNTLEIAVREGSAARILGVSRGEFVAIVDGAP